MPLTSSRWGSCLSRKQPLQINFFFMAVSPSSLSGLQSHLFFMFLVFACLFVCLLVEASYLALASVSISSCLQTPRLSTLIGFLALPSSCQPMPASACLSHLPTTGQFTWNSQFRGDEVCFGSWFQFMAGLLKGRHRINGEHGIGKGSQTIAARK